MIKQGPPVKNSRVPFGFWRLIESSWRLIGTGLSFLVFGLGGLVTSIVIFPLMFVFVRKPHTRQLLARKFVGGAFTVFIALMKGLGVLSYEIEGLENARAGQNQLIIANHPTLIDVVFLVSIFPMADCVVKEGVVRNPFMRGVALPANYISSDDPLKLLESCVMRLESGASLVLFPEGTRSVQGKPLKFKPGAASIAVRAGSEILPVTIHCSQPRLLAKGEPWYRVPPEKPVFSIRIHPAMSQDSMVSGDLQIRQAGRVLNAKLLDFFEDKIT